MAGQCVEITQSDRRFFNEYKDNYTHIVSFICPDDNLEKLHDRHYIIKCWDVDKVLENKFRKYEPPTEEQILNALHKVESSIVDSWYNGELVRCLVHCDMGISRSSAFALGLMWKISDRIFASSVSNFALRWYIDSRKEWCAELVDKNNSVALSRFVVGRMNTGIKPNQAILRIFRKNINLFPW